MTPRDRWITEGFAVLREQGATGVKIDRLAARLGLTKGSFHHHFRGITDYRRVLLERYESDATAVIESALSGVADLEPRKALMSLADVPGIDPRLDAAIRSWASDDPSVLAVQQRVDRARLDALIGLWQQILPDDPARARIAALVPHLVMIGASASHPTLSPEELRQVFGVLAVSVEAVSNGMR